jgi:DNA-binding MarR family transcriptional regulator
MDYHAAMSRTRPAAGRAGIERDVVELSLGLMRAMQHHWNARIAETGVARIDGLALWVLSTAGPLPMRALADDVHLDPSQITAVVDRLEVAGLAERRNSATDRRIKNVALTASGQTYIDDLWARLMSDAPPLRNMTAEDLQVLLALLAKMGLPQPG